MSAENPLLNNLIIIGNGFDLAHGLKTSYSDFIIWYFNQVKNKILDKNLEPLFEIEYNKTVAIGSN